MCVFCILNAALATSFEYNGSLELYAIPSSVPSHFRVFRSKNIGELLYYHGVCTPLSLLDI